MLLHRLNGKQTQKDVAYWTQAGFRLSLWAKRNIFVEAATKIERPGILFISFFLLRAKRKKCNQRKKKRLRNEISLMEKKDFLKPEICTMQDQVIVQFSWKTEEFLLLVDWLYPNNTIKQNYMLQKQKNFLRLSKNIFPRKST